MKRNVSTHILTALAVTSVLTITSCSSPNGTEDVEAIETPDGAIIVQTMTVNATVTAIDADKRKLTLVFPNGSKTTYKCGPEVANFPQIQVGDQVKAVVTEEAAVYIGEGAPPSDVAGAGVALAPIGSKPGGEFVDTMQETAKVTGIDPRKRRVTLHFADGSFKKVKVGKKVNLSAVPIGTDVTIQVSEGLAISVTKP